nr:MAG TPA: hypothetical protein [Caudoviricetes sp.]
MLGEPPTRTRFESTINAIGSARQSKCRRSHVVTAIHSKNDSISSFFCSVTILHHLSIKQVNVPLKSLGNPWHSGILHGKG